MRVGSICPPQLCPSDPEAGLILLRPECNAADQDRASKWPRDGCVAVLRAVAEVPKSLIVLRPCSHERDEGRIRSSQRGNFKLVASVCRRQLRRHSTADSRVLGRLLAAKAALPPKCVNLNAGYGRRAAGPVGEYATRAR